MSVIWITKEKWQEAWALLHNIRIRCDAGVKSPAVTISGVGTAARINIAVPGAAAAAQATIPTFKIIDVSEENAPAVRIVHGSQKDTEADHTCGYVYADNYYSIPAKTISLTAQSGTANQYALLKTTYDTTAKKYVFDLLVLSGDDYSALINNTDKKDVFILGYIRWANGSFSILQTLNIYYYDLRALYWV